MAILQRYVCWQQFLYDWVREGVARDGGSTFEPRSGRRPNLVLVYAIEQPIRNTQTNSFALDLRKTESFFAMQHSKGLKLKSRCFDCISRSMQFVFCFFEHCSVQITASLCDRIAHETCLIYPGPDTIVCTHVSAPGATIWGTPVACISIFDFTWGKPSGTYKCRWNLLKPCAVICELNWKKLFHLVSATIQLYVSSTTILSQFSSA